VRHGSASGAHSLVHRALVMKRSVVREGHCQCRGREFAPWRCTLYKEIAQRGVTNGSAWMVQPWSEGRRCGPRTVPPTPVRRTSLACSHIIALSCAVDTMSSMFLWDCVRLYPLGSLLVFPLSGVPQVRSCTSRLPPASANSLPSLAHPTQAMCAVSDCCRLAILLQRYLSLARLWACRAPASRRRSRRVNAPLLPHAMCFPSCT
jgi:hypothetical protein